MLKYILKRLGFAILALFVLLVLVFFLMQAVPGYPIVRQNNDTDVTYMEKVRNAGLLENVFVQFWNFLVNLFTTGQFGQIYTNSDKTVYSEMLDPIKYTMVIAAPAFVLSSIIGVVLGIFSAYYRGRFVDVIINALSVLFISIPSFILALYLIKLANVIGLPTQFLIFGSAPPGKVILSMLMPILSMTFTSIPVITYYTRNELVEVFKQDYIKVALAKGYKFRQVVFKYALRNALIPIISVILPSFIAILSGSIIIEKFFNVPGTANILIDSISTKEFYIVVFSAVFYGAIYFLLQIIVDVSYTFIDPRIVLAEKKANSWTKKISYWYARKKKLNLLLNQDKYFNYFNKKIDQNIEVVDNNNDVSNRFETDSEEVIMDYDNVVIYNEQKPIPNVSQHLFKEVDIFSFSSEQIAGKPTKYATDVMKRFFKSKSALIFTIILALIVVVSLIVSLANLKTVNLPITDSLPGSVLSYLPTRIPWLGISGVSDVVIDNDTYIALLPYNDQYDLWSTVENIGGQWKIYDFNPYNIPSLSNITLLMGTDGLGRNWSTLLWVATIKSLLFALVVAVPSMIIGTVYGAIAGSYAGRWPDTIMMRIIEILTSVPLILWIMILGLIFGGNTLNLFVIGIALILVNWMGPASTTRTYILKYKDAEFIQAAKTLGASKARIIFNHMLPNILGRLFVRLVNMIPRIIFFEASLVFLGLKSADEISLGTMIETARQNQYIHLLLGPTIMMVLITLSSQIIANNLNDSLDPKVSGD